MKRFRSSGLAGPIDPLDWECGCRFGNVNLGNVRRPTLIAAGCLSASSAYAADVAVATTSQLEAAIAAAKPGDTIILGDGVYVSTGLSCDASGTEQAPIVVRAKTPLAAVVRFDALEGFRVAGDHWHFSGLVVEGVCAVDSDCEHAFHVNGGAGFRLEGSRVVDFNAQLKVNAVPLGPGFKLPHDGLIEGNEIYDTRPRDTDNPVTKLNIDSGDDWVVRANVIHDFHTEAHESYGAFLKCGGQRGIMERNLVVCAKQFSGGVRVGLSLGGGGCGPQFCQPAFDPNTPCVEHTDGIIRNNVIVNCSDVGVYINESANSRVLYNTLIATTGIDFRFSRTTGEAIGNVLAGKIRNRDGSTGSFANNLAEVEAADFEAMYVGPLIGDLRRNGDLSALLGQGPAVPDVTDDYCARARGATFDLGAIQHSLGDCAIEPPPGDGGGDPPGQPEGDVAGGCCQGGSDAAWIGAIPLLLVLPLRPRRYTRP